MRRRKYVLATVLIAVIAAGWSLAGSLPPEALWWGRLAGVLQSVPAVGGPVEQSAAIGAWVAEQAEAHGGDCDVLDGLMVCVNVPDWMRAKGGTTWGDTYISPYPTFTKLRRINTPFTAKTLLAHETYHRDHQWRVHGADFAAMYLTEAALAWAEGRVNRYERDADVHGGFTGYAPDPAIDPRSLTPVAGLTTRTNLVSTPDRLTRYQAARPSDTG